MAFLTKARNLRLRREYQELLSSPIANCSAQPLEENIAVWHANIYVPGLELTFHFVINYPNQYPKKAPKIRNCTQISHPNVFGDYICLDILTMSEETANTPFRGWTSAYTISSLLVQLQSFLFEAIDTEGWGAKQMTTEAATFVCSTCGHSTHYPVPEITCFENGREDVCQIVTDPEEYFFLDECPDIVLSAIFEHVDQDTLGKICHLLGDVSAVTDLALAKRSYKCFYTLTTLNTERVVFGLGAKKAINPRRSRKTGYKTNKLQQLHCSFDFLSHDAFQMGVRNNIWKDRDFDCFIPLYINSKHGRRSLPMAEECILNMWNCPELPVRYKKITAPLVLETLAKLMNTTVVNMMKTVEDLEAGELQLFDSIKALKGYTSMHHLLLAFCDRYPAIKELANARVKKFMRDPLARDKETTPDIGELLIDLAISDYSWDDLSPAWIEEVFIRNARWILSKHPNLFKKEKGASCIRMTQSFHATRTGKRLAMFQRFFISEVASPECLVGNPNKNKILLKQYNERLGLPARGMAERLQEHSRKVIACNNWWDYFTLVDFCVPSAAHLSAWLRSAIEVSSLKEYHSKSLILRYPQNFVTKPHEQTQCNPLHCLCAGSLYKLPENCTEINQGAATAVLVEEKKVGVDICFVMDCTGSMSSVLETAKNHIRDVVAKTSTKFGGETVRFAIVGYRDHDSPGYGKDSYVLKKYDFTDSPEKMYENVSQFHVGGGGGPEAMCCAMAAAARMAWNRNSHQLVVLIGDQPPHGYTYDEPCECGHDTLRVVHTMRKNGIVVYPVDCGYADGDRQTFYHGLARITGGYAFDIRDAGLLPEIVVSACVEEGMMARLKKVVEPMYLECIESHPLGRFEQYCQSVFSQCKAKNVKIQSSLPADGYTKYEDQQVDHIAFCMDIAQAKKMRESEYFGPINRKTKLCSYMKRPVSLSQVTNCMKRMETDIAKAKFLKTGCQYLTHERFSKEEFQGRWLAFKSDRKIGKFAPWCRLTVDQKNTYSRIPNPINISTEPLKAPRGLIHHGLIGRVIEVKLYGVWTRVKVIKLLRGSEVLVQFKGVEFPIKEDKPWRPSTAFASWASKKEEGGPQASPVLLRELNLLNSSQAKKPVPTPARKEPEVCAAPKPAPTPATRRVPEVRSAPRSTENIAPPRDMRAQPSGSDDSGRSRSPPSNIQNNFVIDQLVCCRNREEEEWKVAVISSLTPLYVKFGKNSAPVSCRYVSPVKLTEYTLQIAAEVHQQRDRKGWYSVLPVGTKVRSLEEVDGFLHITHPISGWIEIRCVQMQQQNRAPPTTSQNVIPSYNNTRPMVTKTVAPAPVPPPAPVVLPTLNFLHMHNSISAKDIAHMCMAHGITPKGVKKVQTRYGITARVSFSTFEDAKFIHNLRRLSHSTTNTHMPIVWSEQYFDRVVNATRI